LFDGDSSSPPPPETPAKPHPSTSTSFRYTSLSFPSYPPLPIDPQYFLADVLFFSFLRKTRLILTCTCASPISWFLLAFKFIACFSTTHVSFFLWNLTPSTLHFLSTIDSSSPVRCRHPRRGRPSKLSAPVVWPALFPRFLRQSLPPYKILLLTPRTLARGRTWSVSRGFNSFPPLMAPITASLPKCSLDSLLLIGGFA